MDTVRVRDNPISFEALHEKLLKQKFLIKQYPSTDIFQPTVNPTTATTTNTVATHGTQLPHFRTNKQPAHNPTPTRTLVPLRDATNGVVKSSNNKIDGGGSGVPWVATVLGVVAVSGIDSGLRDISGGVLLDKEREAAVSWWLGMAVSWFGMVVVVLMKELVKRLKVGVASCFWRIVGLLDTIARDMSCFPCFSSQTKKKPRRLHNKKGQPHPYPTTSTTTMPSMQTQPETQRPIHSGSGDGALENYTKEKSNSIAAQTFSFRELASATKNFRPECLIGEGGFGRVYKGHLSTTGQTVAVKQLDRNGVQGNKEFLVEVLMLSLLHHPNLVNLIGYCTDGDQRLLVYEYMRLGSLEDHLLDVPTAERPLDWYTRMKIALDAAKGLEYLHDKANPPVIYRDMKSSNILLDIDFHAKLSDFGLAKLGPTGEQKHVSTRVMGTYGYCAPEYQRTGQLTSKSDVYSYGVVLLELITGRRTIDTRKPTQEQHLVAWATPVFRDPSRHLELADPRLDGNFPLKGLNQAVAIASMCLQDEAAVRPVMCDVVSALSYLTVVPKDDGTTSPHSSSTYDSSPLSDYSQYQSTNHDVESKRSDR
ncbi:hypothetical protein KSS87_011590 [Heliosperma pusillum]|nr:hypothetical protein KSS87_011590 [Heliosperma pusillum]